MQNLMAEFSEDQKARNALFKWKLVAIGTIGSIGLGFSGATTSSAPLVLALIPFVCVYTDLLCRNLSIRIQTLASFMADEINKGSDSVDARYLKFYYTQRPIEGASLESFALVWSTIFLSVLTAILGIILFSANTLILLMLITAGITGVLLSVLVEKRYQSQKSVLVNFINREAS